MQDKNVFDLTGKVAIVTGGSRGLGRAFCETLAKYGAEVVCAGRDETALTETVRCVSEYGKEALACTTNMMDPESIQRMATATIERFGRIDVLVANAGIAGSWQRIDEESTESWEQTIATNLTGQFLSMKAVLPTMMQQHSGSVINIASVGAFGGGNVSPASYGASKAGIIALSRHAAVQYGSYGIRVNCICPGLHITELGVPKDNVGKEERLRFLDEMAQQNIPLGRVAYPEELEGLIALLASHASSYITGAVFVQDGGATARV